SGIDEIHLDATVMTALGASGAFAANDARFFEAAGASAGHDADDRVVYDTSSGNLWYDADGNGGQAAQLVAILDGPTSLAAPDIVVDNGGSGTMPGGQHLVGTPNNDSIVGGEGDDTIEGLGGFDTLVGAGGNDVLAGGSGWDTLSGGADEDTFVFTNYGKGMNDRITDFVSGSDAIQIDPDIFSAIGASGRFSANDPRFHAAPGASAGHDADDRIIYDTSSGTLYYDPDGSGRASQANIGTLQGAPALVGTDLLVQGTGSGGGAHLVGGGGRDSLLGSGGADTLEGFAGNDTLDGGVDDDRFVFHETGGSNADRVVGFVSGSDALELDNAVMSALGADGAFASGDDRFFAAAGASAGHDADDRVVYNESTGQLYYDDDGSGSHAAQLIATLEGTPSLAAADIHVI
ncbi:MAG TPA: calcium-binding protein, partial [Steroidobacteraceae bacterium]|nr:calcium-binding protein [Steroidobacteraceae bacterium]